MAGAVIEGQLADAGLCTSVAARGPATPVPERERRGFRWQQAHDSDALQDAASQAFALCVRWSEQRRALTSARVRKLRSLLLRQEADPRVVARQWLSALLVEHALCSWPAHGHERRGHDRVGRGTGATDDGDAAGTTAVPAAAAAARAGLERQVQGLLALLRATFAHGAPAPACDAHAAWLRAHLPRFLPFALGLAGGARRRELRLSPLKYVVTRCLHVPQAGARAGKGAGAGARAAPAPDAPGGVSGLWLEFGVGEGHSLGLLARVVAAARAHAAGNGAGAGAGAGAAPPSTAQHPGRARGADDTPDDRDATLLPPCDDVVHGFDSFRGLPEDWRPGFAAGHFAQAAPGLPPALAAAGTAGASAAALVRGLFQDTLPGFLRTRPGVPVALLHVDSDLYSSARCVLELLLRDGGRIVPGTVIVFDELINYCGFENHECRALFEIAELFGLRYRWLGVKQRGAMQAALLVVAVNDRANVQRDEDGDRPAECSVKVKEDVARQ
eukprot:g6642.t1